MQTSDAKKTVRFTSIGELETSQQTPAVSVANQFGSGQFVLPAMNVSHTKTHYDPTAFLFANVPVENPTLLAINRANNRLEHHERRLNEIQEGQNKLRDLLTSVLNQLQDVSNSKAFSVQLESVSQSTYELLRPISVLLEGNGDDFTASYLEANVSGTGETEADALADLKDALVSIFETLRNLPDDDLGPLPLRQKSILMATMRHAG